MSTTLMWRMYPKECGSFKVVPYLECMDEDWATQMSGKRLSQEFYQLCNTIGYWHEATQCWIFDEAGAIFEFASKSEVPTRMNDYITQNYSEETSLFIIWKR